MASRRADRWSYLSVVTVFVLLGVACSGGSGDETSSADRAGDTPAAAATPDAAAASPAAENPAGETAPDPADGATGAAPSATPAPSGAAKASKPAAKDPAGPAATPRSASSDAVGGATGGDSGGGAAPAAPTPGVPGAASTPNYASDVGVSADTIRIGTINMTSATRSLGPAIAGVQEQNLDAAVKYINRTGGVSGRKLQLVTCDDGGDITRGRACY